MVFEMSAPQIRDDIRSGIVKIAIIGLGQVGLPLALHFVKEGASVIGVDTDDKRIDLIRRGVCPSSTREVVGMFNLFGKNENFEISTDTTSAVSCCAVAMLCEQIGIDILEVLNAASTKWSFMPHIPGAGVGGTCIPVNPYYLLQCAREAGADLPLVRQARRVNENMPHHMVELIRKTLRRINRPVRRSRICLLGLTYKGDVDDDRGSPGRIIAAELKRMGAEVICYGPFVIPDDKSIEFKGSIEEAVQSAHCIAITTDHSTFRSLDLKSISKLTSHPLVIVDGRHVLAPKEIEDLGITYAGIGRTKDSKLDLWSLSTKPKERSV